jgi:hypothetical protein
VPTTPEPVPFKHTCIYLMLLNGIIFAFANNHTGQKPVFAFDRRCFDVKSANRSCLIQARSAPLSLVFGRLHIVRSCPVSPAGQCQLNFVRSVGGGFCRLFLFKCADEVVVGESVGNQHVLIGTSLCVCWSHIFVGCTHAVIVPKSENLPSSIFDDCASCARASTTVCVTECSM